MLYETIKAFAKEQGVPIYKIEDDCGFSRGSICKWNEIHPSVEKVKKVADYLRTSIDCLLE